MQACIAKGEFKPCDSKRIAASILTVSTALKLKMMQGGDSRFSDQLDYQKLEDEVVFTVSLILDGMISHIYGIAHFGWNDQS